MNRAARLSLIPALAAVIPLLGPALMADVAKAATATGPGAPAKAKCATDDPLAQDPHTFTGSSAYSVFRRSGREVVAERELDIDSDGRPEVLVVGRADEWMDLSAYRDLGERRYELLSRSRRLRASSLGKLEPIRLGPRQGVYLDVFEDSPDEADHHLLVLVGNTAGLVEVFNAPYRERHSEEDAGRTPRDLTDLGHQPLGLTVVNRSDGGDGWPVLVLRHSPHVVLLDAAGRRGVVVHAQRQVWVADQGRYRRQSKGRANYLIPLGARIRLTNPAIGPEPRDSLTLENRGRDGSATGLVVGSVVTVKPHRPGPIRAVRVLPGCTESDEAWRQKGRLAAFQLQLDDRPALAVDRRDPDKLDPRILGVVDLALPDRQVAHQTVIFFRAPEEVSELKLVFGAIEAGDDGSPGACLHAIELLGVGDRPWTAQPTSSSAD